MSHSLFLNSPSGFRPLCQFCRFCQWLGEISLIAACFFLPWSVALMNVATLLMAFCWLISGRLWQLPKILRQSPSATLAIALFLLLAASLAYTSATAVDGLDIVSKYRKLLYLPIVLSMANGAPVLRRRAIDAFLWGCCLLLLVSYFKWATALLGTNMFIDRHGFSLVLHITHSFFMAVFIFFLIERAITEKGLSGRWRWALFIFAALAWFNLFYITPGRTGWGLCLALIAFIFIRRRSWRWLLAGLVILTALTVIIWQSSSIVSVRSWDLIHETEDYQPGASRTSMGMRYDLWHNAVSLFAESPWLGKGVGSFRGEQRKLIERLHQPTALFDNPHNEYLLLAEQTGIVGLLLFLALLVVPRLEAAKHGLPPDDCRLIEGLALAMALGCIVNSFLFDSQQGHFFILMMALLLARDGAVANEEGRVIGGSEFLT